MNLDFFKLKLGNRQTPAKLPGKKIVFTKFKVTVNTAPCLIDENLLNESIKGLVTLKHDTLKEKRVCLKKVFALFRLSNQPFQSIDELMKFSKVNIKSWNDIRVNATFNAIKNLYN